MGALLLSILFVPFLLQTEGSFTECHQWELGMTSLCYSGDGLCYTRIENGQTSKGCSCPRFKDGQKLGPGCTTVKSVEGKIVKQVCCCPGDKCNANGNGKTRCYQQQPGEGLAICYSDDGFCYNITERGQTMYKGCGWRCALYEGKMAIGCHSLVALDGTEEKKTCCCKGDNCNGQWQWGEYKPDSGDQDGSKDGKPWSGAAEHGPHNGDQQGAPQEWHPTKCHQNQRGNAPECTSDDTFCYSATENGQTSRGCGWRCSRWEVFEEGARGFSCGSDPLGIYTCCCNTDYCNAVGALPTPSNAAAGKPISATCIALLIIIATGVHFATNNHK